MASESADAKIRILVVDDEPRVLGSIARLLRGQRDWDLEMVGSGEAALEKLATEPPDVVLSDMRMPGIDGAELLRRVREDYPAVARIMMSAYAQLDEVMDAAPLAHQALSKPCSGAELRATISRARVLRDLIVDRGLRGLVGGIASLPAARGVYHRLQGLARRPNTTLRDVAAVIETDPALAAKMLHVANSAFFAPAVRVTSVERAIGHLGLDLVRALTLSSQVFQTIGGAAGHDSKCVDELQRHALLATQVGKPIVALRPELAEDAWAALLLHDIGELVLAVVVPEKWEAAHRAARDRGVPLATTERELIGYDHAVVGACLLQLWGIPAEVVEAIARHHDLTNGDGDELDLATIVHVTAGLVDELDGLTATFDMVSLERRGLAARVDGWRRSAADLKR